MKRDNGKSGKSTIIAISIMNITKNIIYVDQCLLGKDGVCNDHRRFLDLIDFFSLNNEDRPSQVVVGRL